MSGFMVFLPIIIALLLYFTGIPIAYALMTATLTFFTFIDTTSMPYLLMQKFITSTQSFPFLAIPFFVMAGSLMNYSGMSEKLMAFADALTGHMKGGLAQINVLLSMLMGGCSGSANADAAMECKMLVPEMEKRASGKVIAKQALDSLWALLFPFGIILGMRFGLFTPTEAGGVGVLYCFLVGKFIYKGLKKEHFIPVFRETLAGTCTVMLIIVSASLFGYYLNWENIPNMLLASVSGIASNKYLVLLVLNVFLLIAGMFLEGGAALIILAPLMVPLVKAAGIDLVHFGIIVNVNIMIGGLTPPFGSMMFTCVAITDCKMSEFIREVVPFIIALIIALLLITYIPQVSLLIPDLIY